MAKEVIGLSTTEVENSRRQHGSNQLTEQARETFWQKYRESFNDPIIKILLVALVINLVFAFLGMTAWFESVGIFIAVVLATFVGTFSEFRNENSFQKLQEEAARIRCRVYRDNIIVEIPIDQIVKGDVVLLQSGDGIPADGRLISGEISVDQAALNGEAKEAHKHAMPVGYAETPTDGTDFLDAYKVFRGSVVCSGEALMLVESVGDHTFYGDLAQKLQIEDIDSPLKVKLAGLAKGISKFGYIGGTFIALAFLFDKICIQNSFDVAAISVYFSNGLNVINDVVTALIMAVVIIVVAVPEGLPMMIAMVLAMNMRKMLNDKVLVRKLPGIETAGSINILFTDKTGTLTKGQLEVVTFMTGDGKTYGDLGELGGTLGRTALLSILHNTSSHESGGKIVGGNATERAVLGFSQNVTRLSFDVEQVSSIPFNSADKYSASTIRENGKDLTLVKGAPEKLLPACTHYLDETGTKVPFDEVALNVQIDELAHRAIRVLALCASEQPIDDDFKDLTLVGVLGIRDEIRPESKPAVQAAKTAGIQVVMITGDKKETAIAIAREIGLLTGDPRELVLTSPELNAMEDEELKAKLPYIRVIARALPSDKIRMVTLAQELNLVAGMTGDGVNDAPALKKADVGFAMGDGTDVAKEAGDIVIMDNNFNSIAKAVLYGRTIFKSIRKFIIFQLTINVAAVLLCLIGPFIGFESPLSITQMLWVNLVMDTLAALAFGGEPSLPEYMMESPKRRDESIVTRNMWSQILVAGIFTTALGIFFLKAPVFRTVFVDEAHFLTGFFCLFIFTAVFNGFNARTESRNLFKHLRKNMGYLKVMGAIVVLQVAMTYFGGPILRTVGLTGMQWLVVLGLTFLIVPLDVIRKTIISRT